MLTRSTASAGASAISTRHLNVSTSMRGDLPFIHFPVVSTTALHHAPCTHTHLDATLMPTSIGAPCDDNVTESDGAQAIALDFSALPKPPFFACGLGSRRSKCAMRALSVLVNLP